MRNRKKVFQGFTLIEVLIVMSIFIIVSIMGIRGFLTIRETFLAKENVELIIQDIESAKLRAMNMGKDNEETWVYGFGIDFRDADATYKGVNATGNHKMFKWCSPVANFGDMYFLGSVDHNLTGGVLPNLYTGYDVNEVATALPVNLCGTTSNEYRNGRIPASCGIEGDGYTENCSVNSTSLVSVSGESLSLLDRDPDQLHILEINTETGHPGFVFFEALTGRAIIYNYGGLPWNYYSGSSGEVLFKSDDFIPMDIALTRKRSSKFDLITVYPLSGEIIHHVYSDQDQAVAGDCGSSVLDCFTFEGVQYKRYGIEDEIRSYRD